MPSEENSPVVEDNNSAISVWCPVTASRKRSVWEDLGQGSLGSRWRGAHVVYPRPAGSSVASIP